MLSRGLLHQHLGGFAALALDVEAGSEIVGIDANTVDVVVFGGHFPPFYMFYN